MASIEHCLYCFEVLAADLERRTPMSLYQVQASWDAYPKGLDEDESDAEETPAESGDLIRPTLRNPAVQRVADSRNSSSSSGSSTPASSSTSSQSLAPDSALTTPGGSTDRFSPIGLNPRKTSQREEITESPLFVTWNIISSPSSPHPRSLRGCIGTFETLPLASGLSSYALTSALQDHRFSPISIRELTTLEVSVTLLTDFEPCDDAMDWELGVHGLRISFYAKNKRYGACYLPDVAVEQGWDKEETIVSLMRKAGWGGRKEKWREVGDLKCVRFQGKAESAGWEEYQAWRAWVDKEKKERK